MTAKEIKDKAVDKGKRILEKAKDITGKAVEKGKKGVKYR